jgi:hypothetical protein
MMRLACVLIVLCAGAAPLTAQSESSRSAGGSFAIEWLGGSLGSAAGLAIGRAIHDDCGEDIACSLSAAATSVGISTVGAASGAYVLGRSLDTQPSGTGAILGSILGAAAAIGLDHLLSEDLDVTRNDLALHASFALTQGLVTALGSRLFAALR